MFCTIDPLYIQTQIRWNKIYHGKNNQKRIGNGYANIGQNRFYVNNYYKR